MTARARWIRALVLSAIVGMLGVANASVAEVVVVSASSMPVNEIELRELKSIYKGRLSQVQGYKVTPLNRSTGSPERNEFLSRLLNSTELEYTGYWHVRRYSGQGTPPEEVQTEEQLFAFLKQNPNRIGYLWIPSGSPRKLPEGIKLIKIK